MNAAQQCPWRNVAVSPWPTRVSAIPRGHARRASPSRCGRAHFDTGSPILSGPLARRKHHQLPFAFLADAYGSSIVCRRCALEELGGFPTCPSWKTTSFAPLKRVGGWSVERDCLTLAALAMPGFLRTTLINKLVILGYRATPPAKLRRCIGAQSAPPLPSRAVRLGVTVRDEFYKQGS